MNRQLVRRVSLWLIAMLVFAQASVAMAACTMERGTMMQTLQTIDSCGCETHLKTDGPQYASRCVAHCTADLQLAGLAPTLVRAPAEAPVLLVPRGEQRSAVRAGLEAPPSGAVPLRILLHSFLI